MSTEPPEKKTLSLDDIYHPDSKIDFDGKPPEKLRWFDSDHYLQPGKDEDVPVLKVHAPTGRSEPFYDSSLMRKSLEGLPGLTPEDARRLAARKGHAPDENMTAFLIHHESDLLYYRLADASAFVLAEGRDAKVAAEFSPDGRLVCYIKDNNIHVVEVETRIDLALTKEGTNTTLAGRLDWVYQEELYGRDNFKGYWWSPDSTRIAFLLLDTSSVRPFTLIDHVPTTPALEISHYPKAGQANPTVRLGVVSAAGGPVQWIDTSAYDQVEHLVVRVAWTPEGRSIAYQVQDREQTWLDLNLASAASGASETLFRETSGAWVRALDDPRWLKDESFLWLSERSGWKHLYHYGREHDLARQVTGGEWEVRELHGLDEGRGLVYFTGTEHSHIANHVYRIGLDGVGLTRLSQQDGTHQAEFSPAFDYFIDYSSDTTRPTQARLRDASGEQIRAIDENRRPELDRYLWGETEFLQVSARDGFIMEAMMIRPPDFDPSKKYPVLVHTYGGPSAPKVVDAWGGATSLWHQMLAQRGYIIWICDNRSASGKGAGSAWPVYRNLGELELQDLEDGLAWLKSMPYTNGSRIGIWGWSFGGTLTVNALTRSQAFKVGIAGAPVTDWRLYDTIYTERYMGTPDKNPEGYEKSSLLKGAEHLHGKLLLIHGTMDDNVHMQNSIQLILELQKAGKQFHFMLYPGTRHGIEDPHQLYHLRTLMTDFILENL